MEALLGDEFRGIVTSDRYCAYNSLPVERRHLCWAHLKRNWHAFHERDSPVGVWGGAAITQIDQLFMLWHCFRE